MTEYEMRVEVDVWFNALSEAEAVEVDRALVAAEAHSVKAEYWFMKGWVARNA